MPWTEWRTHCALDRCASDVQQELRTFIWHQFKRYVVHYRALSSAGEAVLEALTPRDAWHLFESHAAVTRERSGKRYKDWMFRFTAQPGREAADGWRCAASLLARDVVRDHLRRECPRGGTEPLPEGDAGIRGQMAARWLGQLPGPDMEAARREGHAAAQEIAATVFDALDSAHRLLLAARCAGRSFQEEALVQRLGASRSTLYERLRDVLRQIADETRARFPDEDEAQQYEIARQAYERLTASVERWAADDPDARRALGLRLLSEEVGA